MIGRIGILLLVTCLTISTVLSGVDKSKQKQRYRRASPPHPGGNPKPDNEVTDEVLEDEPEYHNSTFHVMRAQAFADPAPKRVKGAGKPPANADITGVAAAGGFDTSQYQKYALKLWMIKTFLAMYQDYSIPEGQDQINQGKQLYDSLKLSNFEMTGLSGVAHDMDTAKLKEIVAKWNEKQLISDLDRTEFTGYLDSPDYQKTSRGAAYARSNGEVIFSQIGYATTEIGSYKRGSWAYTFRKVKFTSTPKVTTTRTQKCVLWGVFCETKYDVKFSDRTLTGAEGEALAAYVRAEALKQFHEDNRPFLKMLQAKAKQFKPFLPKELQDDAQKFDEIEKNPGGKKPDEIFPKDPFDMNSFDL